MKNREAWVRCLKAMEQLEAQYVELDRKTKDLRKQASKLVLEFLALTAGQEKRD